MVVSQADWETQSYGWFMVNNGQHWSSEVPIINSTTLQGEVPGAESHRLPGHFRLRRGQRRGGAAGAGGALCGAAGGTGSATGGGAPGAVAEGTRGGRGHGQGAGGRGMAGAGLAGAGDGRGWSSELVEVEVEQSDFFLKK